jgi:hypothetical protein
MLGDKRALSEVLNQALKLKAADIAFRTPSRLCKVSTGTFWVGRQSPQPHQENDDNQRAGLVESQATSRVTALRKQREITDSGDETTDAQKVNVKSNERRWRRQEHSTPSV